LVQPSDMTHQTAASDEVRLLERARIILKEIQLTEAELTNSVAAPSGEVTIGIPSGAARVLISGP
jgi:LysR family nitrogen assimilation transcriptional regulator